MFPSLLWAEEKSCIPKDYSYFTSIEGVLTQEIIDINNYIFLKNKTYKINNPLRIKKRSCFFLHGLDRIETIIKPMNQGEPLFVVDSAQHINISNLKLSQTGINNANIIVNGKNFIALELQDVFSEAGMLIYNSPGSYRMQGVYMTGLGRLNTNIVLNHRDADLQIVGGNIKHSGLDGGNYLNDYAHVHIRQGRFRVYGAGVQRTMGRADFLIEAETKPGLPHQIINVRSEGSKTLRHLPSSFVRVPDSGKVIDIDIVNSSGAWRLSPHGKSTFINHDAKGTIVLKGNTSVRGVSVVAKVKQARLFASNNTVYGKSMGGLNRDNFHLKNNYYSNRKSYGSLLKPYVRKIKNLNAEIEFPSLNINIPAPIRKPRVDKALLGMVNVQDFGVRPNIKNDQFLLIDKIFKKFKYIYFPEGKYIIGSSIGLNNNKLKTSHNAGGWIAGAGSDLVEIINNRSSTVFETYGMAYSTIQGVKFKGVKGDNASGPVMRLENDGNIGHATQEIIFYDIKVIGGETGIAIAENSEQQCSENMFIDVSVSEAHTAISVGNYNALANIFYGLEVEDASFGISHDGELSGGQWAVYGGNFSNIREGLFRIINASNGIWFFDDISMMNAKLLETSHSSAPINVFFNRSSLIDASVSFESAGGVVFNNSDVRNLNYSEKSNIAQNYESHLN